ncbi:MAG: Ig-like domain-containing protein [archaeon]
MSDNRLVNSLFFITVAVMFILSALPVLSVNDFSAYVPAGDISACSCRGNELSLTLQNTGTFAEKYIIRVSGDEAEWATPLDNGFFLSPGESRRVPIMIRPRCGYEGTGHLKLLIESSAGLEKTIPLSVRSSVCRNVGVIPMTLPQPACPCEAQEFAVEISNINGFPETYYLQVQDHPEWFAFSNNPVILDSGQKMVVRGFIRAPCGIYGSLEDTVEVIAGATGHVGSFSIPFTINACYDYSTYVGKYQPIILGNQSLLQVVPPDSAEFLVCAESAEYFPFVIGNFAKFDNAFNLAIEGPEWAWLEADAIAVKPGQTGVVNVFVAPPVGSENQYPIRVYSTSQMGDITQASSFVASVGTCFDYSVDFESDEISTCCHTYDITAKITNDGDRDLPLQLGLSGELAPYASVPAEYVTVPAAGNLTIPITISPVCQEGRYNSTSLSLNAIVNYEQARTERSDSIAIEFAPPDRCYDLEVTNLGSLFNSNRINTDHQPTSASIEVINLGLLPVSYTVAVDGPIWISSSTNEVVLGPGDSTNLTVSLEPFEDLESGDYPFSLLFAGYGVDITFAFDFVAGVGTSGFLGSWWFYILFALILLLIILAILVWVKRSKKGEKKEEVRTDAPKPVAVAVAKEQKEAEARARIAAKEVEAKKAKEKRAAERVKQEKKRPSRNAILVAALIVLLLLLGVLVLGYMGFFSAWSADGGQEEEGAFNMTPSPPLTGNETTPSGPFFNIVPTNETGNESGDGTGSEADMNVTLPEENQTAPVIIGGNETTAPEGETAENASPEPAPEEQLEEGFLYQVWDQGTVREIDLTEAFKDPDNDTLQFNHTPVENISVEISEEGIASLTPDPFFLGRREITFTASDGKSPVIVSPPMVLEVREPELSVFDTNPMLSLLRDYAWYLLAGIIILIVIILVLQGQEKDDKPQKVVVRKKKK